MAVAHSTAIGNTRMLDVYLEVAHSTAIIILAYWMCTWKLLMYSNWHYSHIEYVIESVLQFYKHEHDNMRTAGLKLIHTVKQVLIEAES